jgi:hypothetical protein
LDREVLVTSLQHEKLGSGFTEIFDFDNFVEEVAELQLFPITQIKSKAIKTEACPTIGIIIDVTDEKVLHCKGRIFIQRGVNNSVQER